MNTITIPLYVHKNVSSCNALRYKGVNGDFLHFMCGLDILEDVFIANYPHVYDYTLEGLVTSILNHTEWVDKRPVRHMRELHIVDDTEATVISDDDDDYKEELGFKYAKNKKEFDAFKDRALRELVWNEQIECWVGEITINIL